MSSTTVISVVSTKGGVGKTTVAANLGGLLAALNQRVLLVDCDVQDGLSKVYPTVTTPTTGIGEVITRGGIVQPSDIVATVNARLSIITSNVTDSTQSWLANREDRLILLKRAVRQPIITEQFDVVVLDTQGAKGQLQRTAAMAADLMVIPTPPAMMAIAEFTTGTLEMLAGLNAMADVSSELRAGALRVLINMVDRTKDAQTLSEVLRQNLRSQPGISVLDTTIPMAAAYREARTHQLAVHTLSRPTKHRPGTSAYEHMHALVHELLPHLKGLWVDGKPPHTEVRDATELDPVRAAQACAGSPSNG